MTILHMRYGYFYVIIFYLSLISHNSNLQVTTPQYCAYFMKVLYGAMIRPTKEKYNLSSTKHFGDIYHEQDC